MAAGQNSLNTNVGALVALSNLNTVNSRLDQVQDRVSTGLKVIGAVDNASSFAIAQGIRGDVKAYGAVSQGIANAKGLTTIALAGATAISDLLGDIQAKITGTILCTGPLTIGKDGAVFGDVTARSINIEPGGELNGAMNIVRTQTMPRPAL